MLNRNCKLLQPVVALPKDGRATIMIPAGTVVEVRPAPRKAGITELLWEGECFSAQLHDVLDACPIQAVGRLGWHWSRE